MKIVLLATVLVLQSFMAIALHSLDGLAISGVASRHNVERAQIMNPGDRWNLTAALANQPPGAFYALMNPVLEATTLAYTASHGVFEQSAGSLSRSSTIPPELSEGGTWERIFALESNPVNGGVHAVVFADHAARQVIIGYEGSCQSPEIRQCQADRCYLLSIKNFGRWTDDITGTNESNNCGSFSRAELDYVGQADEIAIRVRARFPAYGVVLTGHSMGGNLAILTAAQHPHVLQAVAISPSPFHEGFSNLLGYSEAQIRALPADDLISIGDVFDLGINTALSPLAREGSTTCLLHGYGEPLACEGLAALLSHGLPDSAEVLAMSLCKPSVHDGFRYRRVMRLRGADGSPLSLPNCSPDFSTILSTLRHMNITSPRQYEEVFDAMR